MLDFSELQKGKRIIIANQPYEIIEAAPLFKGRGHSVLQARIKNLVSGEILSKTFHPSDVFEEAEIEEFEAKFLYSHRGKYFFAEKDNPKRRFELTSEILGKKTDFLIQGQEVRAQVFQERIINIVLPIKIQLKVVESPPDFRGNRAEAGVKQVTLETGAKINVPLFIKEGDIIEVNTETEEYVRRVK